MEKQVFENERQNIWAFLSSLKEYIDEDTDKAIAESLGANARKVGNFKTLVNGDSVAGHCFQDRCEVIKMAMFEVSDKLANQGDRSTDATLPERELDTGHTTLAGPRSSESCPWRTTRHLISNISRILLKDIVDMLAVSVGMLTMHPYDDQDQFSVVMATIGYAKDQVWMEEAPRPENPAEQNYLSSIWGFLQHLPNECDCNICRGKYSPQERY